MKKKLTIFGVIIVGVIIAFSVIFKTSSTEDRTSLFITAKRGDFTVEVTTTGELSRKIYQNLRAKQC